jgi:phosphohistidine phosphatase
MPDLILSNPAKRALKTAPVIADKLEYKRADTMVDERLYATAPDDLLRIVRELGAKPKSIMLFDHNPELTELAHRLSKRITHLPTCAVAEFAFDAKSWSTIGKAEPESVALHTPK